MYSYIQRKMVRECKPIRFKLYFSNRQAYVRVFIWKSKGDMTAGVGRDGFPSFLACYIPRAAQPVRKLKSGKTIIMGNAILGEVHFYRDRIGVGIVVHELLHALFDLVYKIKVDIRVPSPVRNKTKGSDFCEYLCQELEYMNKRFWINYYKKEKEIKKL